MSSKRAGNRSGVVAEHDAYGQEIWNCHKGVSAYENWPAQERDAIDRARGHALDIGCGAGRVALYLQSKGHRVLAIDNSPLAVQVAKSRGVKAARVLAISDIQTLRGAFGTIVLYGNNFGLLGGMTKAQRLLAAMHRITSPEALIIAASSDPYFTRDPIHLAYHKRNRARGRMSGQIRLRIRYCQFRGPWFDYLFASQDEVRSIVDKTGWTVAEIIKSQGPGFVSILKKA